ncbi:cysteine-rich receptor-like protein kinase 4 [Quercus suber]|uniref:Cysteine-rich receptor-like protein kinase 4 n=1 Tax=Quercus suber TaxID=58331 RepID=A0AAW0LS61_QUESU
MLWFACGLGRLEIISIFVVWCLFIRTQKSLVYDKQGYDRAAFGFKKFTYIELKKATNNFTKEIGRGAGGIVYKGKMAANTSLLKEIIDPMLECKYNIFEMEAFVKVALQCVEEDKDERPTMSQVVEMLLHQEKVNDGVKYDECNLLAYKI